MTRPTTTSRATGHAAAPRRPSPSSSPAPARSTGRAPVQSERQPGEWRNQGACVGLDPALFFPERGESAADAKAVCAGCRVREVCLDYAVTRPEKHGIWGGLSERERRRLRRQRSLAAARVREAS